MRFAKEFVRAQSKKAYYTTPTIFTLNGVLYFNTCMHGLEELLRYADRNSMAHGREVRLPQRLQSITSNQMYNEQ